ncbi:hypothetical protein [Breoghania sp.]|uniref:hypothetical protein n=1 Tax=Breoghania sp. TaxID=2065378 RepID=UPI002AA60D6A|nr:hypothetical protein [Breoghania sp.]
MAGMRTIFALFMPVLAAFVLASLAIVELGASGFELSQLAPSGFELLQRQNDQTHRALQDQLRQRENQIRDRRMDEIRRKSDETRRLQSVPPGTTPPYVPVPSNPGAGPR